MLTQNATRPAVGNLAVSGDRLHVHSRATGSHDRFGDVIEVQQDHGAPVYLVRFEDGFRGLVFPGPDTTVETADRPEG